MPVPETTSAEAFERYVGGKCLRMGRGKAWRDIKAWIVELPPVAQVLPLPSVSEPFLAWNISGEVEFQEREGKRPWMTHRLKRGTFFLTTGGAPYECRWKALTTEPFQAMQYSQCATVHFLREPAGGLRPWWNHNLPEAISPFQREHVPRWWDAPRTRFVPKRAHRDRVRAIAVVARWPTGKCADGQPHDGGCLPQGPPKTSEAFPARVK